MKARLILAILFAANLLGIVVFWWLGSSPLLLSLEGASVLIAFGRLLGLLAEFCILIQLILISRITFVEQAFGFDKLNKVHRTLGFALGAAILLHPILLIVGYANLYQVSLVEQTLNFLVHWPDVAKAAAGLVLLLILVFFSLPFIRKRLAYGSWHVSHLFMYGAIALIFLHQVKGADIEKGIPLYWWYAMNLSVFGALIVYRFLRPVLLFFRHRFYVEKIVAETKNVFSVYIAGMRMDALRFEPGQYIHVSFLKRGYLEPHPFSISLAPNKQFLRLSIKAVGDFTSAIKNLQPGTKALIEGPFGKFTEDVSSSAKYLLIAGGIGITPLRALAESLHAKGKDFILLYGVKTQEDLALLPELERVCSALHVVFSEAQVPGYEHGTIDKNKIQKFVPDVRKRDVYVCGPPPMMDAVIAALQQMGVPKKQIHSERFSY